MPSQGTIYAEMLFAVGQGAGGVSPDGGAASSLKGGRAPR